MIALDDAQATILDAVAPLTPRPFARRDARGLVLGYDLWEVGVVGCLAVLVVVRHAANIRRLLRREEIGLGVGRGA